MKGERKDLAINGGMPAFEQPLYVGRPNIGDRAALMRRIDDLLDRRWLTNNGPYVQELEAKVAALVGVKHCIATCNATVALEVAQSALGMSGSVIVPSFTFIATAHSLMRQGIEPIFCDIDPVTHTLDPARVEALIRPDTTGIAGVHLWGRGCDVQALEAIAQRRGLKLLFDSAHAFGCTHKGRMIGGFGDAEVFSFHATKAINSFEGGAIVTNDDDLAARIRLMINFGFADYDEVSYLGANGKMSEPCAAMGLTSIEAMDEIFTRNRENYAAYRRGLEGLSGASLISYDEAERSNHQYVVVEIDEVRLGLSRDALQQVLIAENVIARRYFYPGCHGSEPYRSLPQYQDLDLPVTDELCRTVLCLPTGTAVGETEIGEVCNIIRLAAHG
jgi:dTDP-4-amino-4,6-dideoxygalactose transaminase